MSLPLLPLDPLLARLFPSSRLVVRVARVALPTKSLADESFERSSRSLDDVRLARRFASDARRRVAGISAVSFPATR